MQESSGLRNLSGRRLAETLVGVHGYLRSHEALCGAEFLPSGAANKRGRMESRKASKT